MHKTWTIFLIFLAASCSNIKTDRPEPVDLIIQGATVIHPENDKAPAIEDIVIRSGKIVAVGSAISDRYEAKKLVDAKGRFVIPGLADMHSHFGNGILEPEQDDTRQVLARHLYFGNTTILNLGSFQAWPGRIDQLRKDLEKSSIQGPRLLAVGSLMTMPGSHPTTTIYSPEVQAKISEIVKNHKTDSPIDLAPLRATTLVRNESDVTKEVNRVGKWGADAVKITVESGPDDFGDDHPQMSPTMIAAASEGAKAFKIPVLCHISSLDELEACLENGAAGIVHAVTSESPLPMDLESRMVKAGFVVIPTASMFEGWKRYTADPELLDQELLTPVLSKQEKFRLTSPGLIEAFKTDASWDRQLAILSKHLKKFHDMGGTIIAGTDTGNPYRIAGFALHEEIAFYVKSGMSNRDALATATVNAARLVGAQEKWGSIKPGLAADLLILAKDPLADIGNTLSIVEVVRDGNVVDRSKLPLR